MHPPPLHLLFFPSPPPLLPPPRCPPFNPPLSKSTRFQEYPFSSFPGLLPSKLLLSRVRSFSPIGLLDQFTNFIRSFLATPPWTSTLDFCPNFSPVPFNFLCFPSLPRLVFSLLCFSDPMTTPLQTPLRAYDRVPLVQLTCSSMTSARSPAICSSFRLSIQSPAPWAFATIFF